MTTQPQDVETVASPDSQSQEIGADDTPPQPENQGEQSVKGQAAGARSVDSAAAVPPPPHIALAAIDKHMAKLNGHMEERERLAIAGVDRNVRKPYLRRWVREANQFFRLTVHLKHRRARISKRAVV